MRDWLPLPPPVGRSGRDRTQTRAKGEGVDGWSVIDEIITQKCGLVDEIGGCYEAGSVREGGGGSWRGHGLWELVERGRGS